MLYMWGASCHFVVEIGLLEEGFQTDRYAHDFHVEGQTAVTFLLDAGLLVKRAKLRNPGRNLSGSVDVDEAEA